MSEVTAEQVAACADFMREHLVAYPAQPRPWALSLADVVVAKFYELPGNEVGGALHIVLDDSNLGDGSIERCIEQAPQDVAAVAVGRMLLAMTYEERAACDFVCQYCRGNTT